MILREQGTDLLFAGFLDRALDVEERISIEPIKGERIHFCQDHPVFEADFVFYALPSHREEAVSLKGKNCALVSYAACPDFHRPLAVKKDIEVGFVGRDYYSERNDYLGLLGSEFSTSFYSQVSGEEIPAIYSRCKVLFNHTRPEIDVNLRFFEQMALGCQVMLRTPSLKEFATEGVHYLGYSSPKECVSQIKRLLKDASLRKKITYNARAHFLSNHTYQHRALSIKNHLKAYDP